MTTEVPIIIKRREVVFTKNDDAISFLESAQESSLPLAFKKWVADLLVAWKLLDAPLTDLSDQRYEQTLLETRLKLQEKQVVLNELPEYEDSKEVSYSKEEVAANPLFMRLQEELNEELTFRHYFESTTFTTVVIRRDGTRQVIKHWRLKRDISEMREDLNVKPEIFPDLEIIDLRNGTVIVLINWIEGKNPQTENERRVCLEAAKTLTKVKKVDSTQNLEIELDLNNSNFKITDDGKVFYIDQHLIKRFIEDGFED